MNLGFKIKKLRELKGLSQEQVSDKLGINQGSYSRIENGTTDIPFSKIEQIATILGLNVEDLISFNEKIIFNLKNNKRANGLVINGISQNEKKLYDEYISTLQAEIAYLKTMVDKLLNKK